MSTRYKMIIFDWDGTLMDSLSRIVSCMQAAGRDLDLPSRSEKQVHDIIGLGLEEAISQLYPRLPATQVAHMRARYAHHYLREDHSPSRFYEGVLPMLDNLRERPVWLSVATGKSRKGLDRVMQAASSGHYFHSSRCSDETESKPSPRMVLELLDLHGVSASDAIVVGDTEFDMAMAENAGVDRIGVGWGAHQLHRLEKYQPKACFNEVSDLADWLLA
ncbi:MAG: HAD-IA family hydrolase [Ketobacteraceae bacterium]|nr:HAD-IA family hydrolase [Ketobacteraceae bacterium]